LDATGYRSGLVQTGWHMLISKEMLEGTLPTVEQVNSLGIETEFTDLASSRIADLVNPDGVVGVVYEPTGGYADPVHATEAFVEAFEALGGEFRPNSPVEALVGDAKEVTGVKVRGKTLEAGVVVNAAGPWAGKLGESVGLDMPLRVVREQDSVWEIRPGRPIPEGPISNQVDLVYARPLGGRRFVVGRSLPKPYHDVDPDNYKVDADEDFISDLMERLERRYPWFQGAARIDSYAALYDATPDWYPIAGPRTGVTGYVDAWGGSGHGFKLAPAIGRRLADWIVDGKTDEEFAQMSHDRVAQDQLFVQRFGGNRG